MFFRLYSGQKAQSPENCRFQLLYIIAHSIQTNGMEFLFQNVSILTTESEWQWIRQKLILGTWWEILVAIFRLWLISFNVQSPFIILSICSGIL